MSYKSEKYQIDNSESITVFTENIFTHSVLMVTHSKYNDLESYFTDCQAKVICLKMSNRRIRHFAKLFLTDNVEFDRNTLRYQIHYVANKALKFYGGKILTFISELKDWSTHTSNVNVEVLKMNPNAVYDLDPNFPKLRIQSYENSKSYTIIFTRAYERYGANYYPIRITNNYTRQSAWVSINGQLIDNFENFIPEIAIFKEMTDQSFQLYSGYDDEFCDICGRRLEDPISIKYGRGPTCRNNHGTP